MRGEDRDSGKRKIERAMELVRQACLLVVLSLCHPSKPSATSVPLHTLSQTKACVHAYPHCPKPQTSLVFLASGSVLGMRVAVCVSMCFKAVLFRMHAGRESGFTADKSIWLISFCPCPLTRSVCMCVCLTQAIEVGGAPGGWAGDGDWHQPSASSVTKSFLRDRKGSQ